LLSLTGHLNCRAIPAWKRGGPVYRPRASQKRPSGPQCLL